VSAPGADFREGHVEADGFRIRYMQAGQGAPLVHLHGAGGLRLTPAHDLLAQRFRVVAFEMPGFGLSPENTKTRSMPELASTMARAAQALGLDTFNLMGTSFGGKTALWLAVQAPERVPALVLEAPAGTKVYPRTQDVKFTVISRQDKEAELRAELARLYQQLERHEKTQEEVKQRVVEILEVIQKLK